MARPNMRKESNAVIKRYHKDLIRLINARRTFLINDGQKFAEKASDADISKEFVDHYWRLSGWTIVGKRMRRYFVTKCNGNI